MSGYRGDRLLSETSSFSWPGPRAKTDVYNVDVNVSDIKYIDRDEVLEQSSVADSDIMMISHFILG